ncbi:hypothetical protein QTP88_007621 [Uroleucon formosanum]
MYHFSATSALKKYCLKKLSPYSFYMLHRVCVITVVTSCDPKLKYNIPHFEYVGAHNIKNTLLYSTYGINNSIRYLLRKLCRGVITVSTSLKCSRKNKFNIITINVLLTG